MRCGIECLRLTERFRCLTKGQEPRFPIATATTELAVDISLTRSRLEIAVPSDPKGITDISPGSRPRDTMPKQIRTLKGC